MSHSTHRGFAPMIRMLNRITTDELLERIALFEVKCAEDAASRKRNDANRQALLLMHNELNERKWQAAHPPIGHADA